MDEELKKEMRFMNLEKRIREHTEEEKKHEEEFILLKKRVEELEETIEQLKKGKKYPKRKMNA